MEGFELPAIRSLVLIAVLLSGCRGKGPAVEVAPREEESQFRLKFKDCNLVFVSFDALQAAHVGALGYKRNVTPTIDSIAKQGTLFTRVYSVASWTVPASMTWFTGVYPSEHRMTNKFAIYTPGLKKPANLKEMSPALITLAEILRLNGYATGGFTGNAGVSGGFGYEQGFDTYFYEQGKFGGFNLSMPKAIEWLKANKDKKFFLFLHGYDCHGQYSPAEGYDYRYVDRDYDQRYTGSETEQEVLREEGLENGQLTLRDGDVRFWRAVYDEKINRADERFRQFLTEFEKLGVSDKTLFILTSDHGTEVYEHRRLDHGFTLYDEQIHVPLIIRCPGMAGGKRIADRVSSIDIMPTLLDLLDINTHSLKDQLRGQSLVSAMQGEPVRRDCYSETNYREYTFKRSIINPEGWKLILTLEKKSRELYNLESDPAESVNLEAKEKKLADQLEEKLYAYFKSIGHDLTGKRWETGLNPVYSSQGNPKK